MEKEVLTITHSPVYIEALKYVSPENWKVNVYFEFNNPAQTNRVIQLGFVAKMNTNGDVVDSVPVDGYISNFSIEVNGKSVETKNKFFHHLKNSENDPEISEFVFLFTVDFKPGKNTIIHSYKCNGYMGDAGQMNGSTYGIDYVLKTGVTWADGTIKDFTLKISSTEDEVWTMNELLNENYTIAGLQKKDSNRLFTKAGATIILHRKNFHPVKNLEVSVKSPWYLTAGYPVKEADYSCFGIDAEKNFSGKYYNTYALCSFKSR